MPGAEIEDYRWLLSNAAVPYLEEASASNDPLATVTRLRRSLSASRAALVVEQAHLRARAAKKFPDAASMFFTPRALEQATDAKIADYKAVRFAPFAGNVADLCCGIGGDLAALSNRLGANRVIGVDRDEIAALLASANAVCKTSCADVTTIAVEDFAAWHLDPDRRPSGRRTTRVDLHEPSVEVIENMLAKSANAGIKLAPAAVLPQSWPSQCELEWIGHDRQCQQLVAWFGGLAQIPGKRRATILDAAPTPRTVTGDEKTHIPAANTIGRYVYEPHPAVLAASLGQSLAALHGLESVAPNIAYYTSDQTIDDPAVARFEVLETLPLRIDRLKAALAARNAGPLEIKKRDVAIEPDQLRKQLATRGDEQFTLLLTRQGKKSIAILARRIRQ